MNLTRPLIFLDTESTGPEPCEDRIIELGVVVLHPDKPRHEWVQRFRPPIEIPDEAIAIHGITNADVAECPPFSEWARRIHAGMQGADFAGFNCRRFDLPLIDEELRRCGLKLNLEGVRVIDCFTIFQKKEPRKLEDAVRRYCGREHTGAHGALSDAAATADVLAGQLATYPDLDAMTIEEVAEFSRSSEGKEADLGGKLYYRSDGALCFSFGKHKDKPVHENRSYARWMLGDSVSFPGSTCDLLREALGIQQ